MNLTKMQGDIAKRNLLTEIFFESFTDRLKLRLFSGPEPISEREKLSISPQSEDQIKLINFVENRLEWSFLNRNLLNIRLSTP